MNDLMKGAILGAALIGYTYAQANDTTDKSTQNLTYATTILLAGAAVGLVANLIGCCTQVIGAYNHYKNAHRAESREPAANKPLLDMKVREYATEL